MIQKFKFFLKIGSLLILTTFLLVALIFFYQIKTFSKTPGSISEDQEIIITINKGDSLNKVISILEQNQLISSSLKFKIYAKFNKKDKKTQVGEYSFKKTMTPEEILNSLSSGAIKLRKTTIPEGYTIAQIAKELEDNKICKKDEFVKLSNDNKLLKQFGIKGPSFEGYLFPETYFFAKNTKAETVIKTMIGNFFKIYSTKFSKRAKELGMSDHEIIILASIIEKETGSKDERTIVSSVFHNRLKKQMRLETDPSVIYGIKDFDGNITRADLREPTPYNTYIIKGLPPGPIANPGLKSIEAALYPADTEFLFFVSKKDGTHYFSKTYKEHKKAVEKFQLGR
ncbi:MAG: endolytic transglycosylase MltG [Desulforegulaceae bacterium]|nr:endolytic transglycosylase MltG [Desulforegulaceae bacterium]